MGFFSWNCKCCGYSIRSQYADAGENNWMAKVVAIIRNGGIIKGEYDGYGRISTANYEDVEDLDNHTLYHEACWEKAGQPKDYMGPSHHAADQGYFTGPSPTLLSPLTKRGEEEIRKHYLSQAQAFEKAAAEARKLAGWHNA